MDASIGSIRSLEELVRDLIAHKAANVKIQRVLFVTANVVFFVPRPPPQISRCTIALKPISLMEKLELPVAGSIHADNVGFRAGRSRTDGRWTSRFLEIGSTL